MSEAIYMVELTKDELEFIIEALEVLYSGFGANEEKHPTLRKLEYTHQKISLIKIENPDQFN